MVGFGLLKDAPWYAKLPMLAALIMMSWLLTNNPQSGAVLTRAALRFYHGKLDRTIALSGIAAVETHIWSEGPDEVIPPNCHCPKPDARQRKETGLEGSTA